MNKTKFELFKSLPTYLPAYLSIYLSTFSIYLPTYLPIYLSIYLPTTIPRRKMEYIKLIFTPGNIFLKNLIFDEIILTARKNVLGNVHPKGMLYLQL